MFLSFIIALLFISGSAASSDVLQSDYGVKFGIVKSRISVSYSASPYYYQDYDFPRLGPVFGLFYRRNLKIIPLDATLSYRQEGGVEKWYVTTPLQPNGTGEFAREDTQYDLVDVALTVRPGKRFGKVEISLVGGGCVSYVLGVNGVLTESDSYKRFIFASTYGVEFHLMNRFDWKPFIEILMRNELTDIYDHGGYLGEDGNRYSVKHRTSSIAVQLGLEL